jgi:hypothetical protein
MTEIDPPICVVQIYENGDIRYFLGVEVGLRGVDESVAHDRVYQLTFQTSREEIVVLVGSSPTGSRHDTRHEAVEHRIPALGSRQEPIWKPSMTMHEAPLSRDRPHDRPATRSQARRALRGDRHPGSLTALAAFADQLVCVHRDQDGRRTLGHQES